jgi:hypothetical protein
VQADMAGEKILVFDVPFLQRLSGVVVRGAAGLARLLH